MNKDEQVEALKEDIVKWFGESDVITRKMEFRKMWDIAHKKIIENKNKNLDETKKQNKKSYMDDFVANTQKRNLEQKALLSRRKKEINKITSWFLNHPTLIRDGSAVDNAIRLLEQHIFDNKPKKNPYVPSPYTQATKKALVDEEEKIKIDSRAAYDDAMSCVVR